MRGSRRTDVEPLPRHHGVFNVPISKTVIAIVAVPAAIAAYVAIAGTTGFCPTCTGIMDNILGRNTAAAASTTGRPETLAGLKATSLTGETIALESFIGKPVILDFWATWCPPCNAQRTVLSSMHDELQGNVRVVALSVDTVSPRAVQDHITKSGHAEENDLMDSGGIAQAFGVSSIPTLVFVDATGKVRKVVTGLRSADDLRREIAALQQPGI